MKIAREGDVLGTFQKGLGGLVDHDRCSRGREEHGMPGLDPTSGLAYWRPPGGPGAGVPEVGQRSDILSHPLSPLSVVRGGGRMPLSVRVTKAEDQSS
jgi:hypothetical protein